MEEAQNDAYSTAFIRNTLLANSLISSLMFCSKKPAIISKIKLLCLGSMFHKKFSYI